MAPNIQLAGKFSRRSSSDSATAVAASSPSASGVAGAPRDGSGPWPIIPAAASSSGTMAVRMITRMICTTAMPATSAFFSVASMTICDSAPGLPASKAEVRSQPWTRCR